MTNKKIYIAGKITGLPVEVYTKNFEKSCEYLLEQGYDTVNPVEVCEQTCISDWRECMGVCLYEITQCDGIYMQRDWQSSVGARLELQVALAIYDRYPDFIIMFEGEV